MDILYTSDGRKYEGMSQNTVLALLNDLGVICTFVDKATYDTYIASKRVD